MYRSIEQWIDDPHAFEHLACIQVFACLIHHTESKIEMACLILS